MTDEELKELVASLAVVQRETAEQFKETDRVIKELSISQKETDIKFKKLAEESEISRKSVDKQLKELGKQIGGIGEKFGSFTEGMAFPSMTKILHEKFGMNHISPNHIAKSNGSSMELDVFAHSSELKTVCIVEVKSHLKAEGVKQMMDILKKFPKFFPDYADRKLYGILAAVKMDKGVDEIVLKSGIYLANIRDEHFRLKIPEGFKARNFQAIEK